MPRSKTTSATKSIPAEGQYLDSPKNKWKIGTKIGSGACGSVHHLVKCSSSSTSSSSSKWVVKLAIIPPAPPASSSSSSSSGTAPKRKKKKNLMELNADLLYHENTLYRNVLNDLRGTMVPDVPMGSGCPIGFGDIEGYRFIVMERMEAPLSSLIPIIYQESIKSSSSSSSSAKSRSKRNRPSSSSSKNNPIIHFGKISSRLITLLEAMHTLDRVFIDVKPENFMLASSTSRKSKGGNTIDQKLDDRVRMIDLGLVESYLDVTIRKSNKHRLDENSGSIAGTPLYASRNVMRGHTLSRRDDLEACGYVICELILQLREYASDCNSGSSSRNEVEVKENLLPWSGGTSDEQLLRLKEKALSNEDGGAFYKSLSSAAAGIMEQFFDIVGTMEYRETPDYSNLRSILGELTVSLGGDNTGIRRQRYGVHEEEEEEEEEEVEQQEDDDSIEEVVVVEEKKVVNDRSTRRQRRSDNPKTPSEVKNDPEPCRQRTTRNSARRCPPNPPPIIAAAAKTKPASTSTTTRMEPQSSSKRKTRASSSGRVQNPTTGEEEQEGGIRRGSAPRKKRVTRIERIVTTVEIIDDSDDDDDDDEFMDMEEFDEYQVIPSPVVVEDSIQTIGQEAEHQCEEKVDYHREEEEKEEDDSDGEMMSTHEGHDDNEMEMDEESFQSCHASISADKEKLDEDINVPMDIDIHDENEKENCVNTIPRAEATRRRSDTNTATFKTSSSPSNLKGATKSKKSTDGTKVVKKKLALKLVCIEGPHEGESIEVEDTVTFGQNPRAKKHYKLGNDVSASTTHAKILLNKSGKGKKAVLSMRVTDLKSTNGTFVNGKMIPSGGGKQAFIGNTIQFGDCVFQIKNI